MENEIIVPLSKTELKNIIYMLEETLLQYDHDSLNLYQKVIEALEQLEEIV